MDDNTDLLDRARVQIAKLNGMDSADRLDSAEIGQQAQLLERLAAALQTAERDTLIFAAKRIEECICRGDYYGLQDRDRGCPVHGEESCIYYSARAAQSLRDRANGQTSGQATAAAEEKDEFDPFGTSQPSTFDHTAVITYDPYDKTPF